MISLNKKKKFNEIRVIVKDKNSYRFEFVYKNQKFIDKHSNGCYNPIQVSAVNKKIKMEVAWEKQN